MNPVSRMRKIPFVGLFALGTACTGSGSDVGPKLDHLPSASNRVLVLDPAGRGVSGARVTIAGTAAVTGRSGRAELLANPTGRNLVAVDATNASALATDRLASLSFAAAIPSLDLPFAVFLPDTSASAAQTVATGVALSATTLDDTATSGARLVLGGGTVVAATGTAATLRLGMLTRDQLPGELPASATGIGLWTRGIWVDPPTVTFAPAATLEVPDELALPISAGAVFHHLDPISGEWVAVSTTLATSSGGRLQLANGVASGGLYAYSIGVAAAATVRGRLVDLQARPVVGAMIRVDAAKVTTDGNGRFTAAVAGELADGTARAVDLDLRGGALYLPATRSLTSPALGSGADVDLGDVVFDTLPAGTLRLQVIEVGRAESLRRLAVSSLEGATALTTMTDARGQCAFEDLPAGFYGFFEGHTQDRFEVVVAEAIGALPIGLRRIDERLFFDDRAWFIGSRSTSTKVIDAIGGGPVRDAAIVRGATAGAGYSGITREGGVVFVGRDFDGRATAVVRTVAGTESIISAFTIDRPNGDHLEMPVARARRASTGAFDRHGTLAGAIQGFVGSADHALRSRRPLALDEWCDEVLLDKAATDLVPTRLGTGAVSEFRAGVALPRGHVIVTEGTTASSRFTLTGIGGKLDLEVAEGTRVAGDLALRRTFATFTAPQGFAGRDAGLTAADFRYDLALRQPSGRIVDIARDIGGGISEAGGDAVLQLPTLDGEFAGGTWLVALRAATAGDVLRQRSLLQFASATGVTTPMLAAPTITAPTDGTSVPVDGFAVDFTLPTGTAYATLHLSSPGVESLEWTAVVPADRTHFEFVRLPIEASTPMLAARNYSLTLTAFRIDEGVVLLQPDPYRELTNHWHAIGTGQRGVRALSAHTIQIRTN